ncbi:RNA-directed DNA polymerase, eukaryota, partial [Tanacetum coccineum]
MLDLEESKDALFARKRICIRTKQEDNILEKFKIIIRGKVFVVRAKELFAWTPEFKHITEGMVGMDDNSVSGDVKAGGKADNNANSDDESDVEGVSDTVFGDQDDNTANAHVQEQIGQNAEGSYDPFNIYDLLRNKDAGVTPSGVNTSFTHPPGFTPEKDKNNTNEKEQIQKDTECSQNRSEGLSSRILVDEQQDDQPTMENNNIGLVNNKKGGSILEVLDDMIKIGQVMGYSMDGCRKDIEAIIGLQGAHDVSFLSIQETKAVNISDMEVKFLWGNYCFEQISSDAIGCSGGILCVWDPNVFLKDQHIISDNFVMLYGTWIPSKTKICIISIYAPQAISEKRMLWNYISLLLSRWDGECVVMGDFNKVRTESERFGSVFNTQGAFAFNDFISNSGLFDVPLEGYSFTWSHPSLHELKESDARDSVQKAKVQWAIEGDENSRFFHGVINRKRANLAIRGVMVDGEWVDDPSRIKEAFRTHFATCFQSPNVNRSRLAFEFPKTLNPEQVSELESPISKDEIRKAVWACGENKSPGPDGFTFEFFRKFWDNIGPDFCSAVEWFFDHCSFAKGSNSSFIALLLKAVTLVTKILATRLSLVISELISDVQTTFVAGRQILDGPFIINDLLSWCKHNNKQTMVFKVDFAKAYDSVRWDYLDDVLRSFGFGSKWCSWIKDDAVFIGEWSQDNLNRILNVLHCFHLASGLRINVKKSHLLGVGVMIEGNTLKTDFWGDIVRKLNSRMSKWKLKTLSIGGRLTLLKSVLGATPIYNMSLFKVPKTGLNLMESIRRDFFYGFHGEAKKNFWVKWSKVLAVKKFGGLGVSSFFALNRALLFKWVWRFISRDN